MSGFTPAPLMRPRPNLGCLMDIPAGEYVTGKFGDSILNGGFGNFIGIGGTANTFKTVLSCSIATIILSRYMGATLTVYDTEHTFSPERLRDFIEKYPQLDFDVSYETGTILVTSAAEHPGEDWWRIVRELSADRAKNKKSLIQPTPFLDKAGHPIKAFIPQIHLLDSMSEFKPTAIEDMHNKNLIDSSGNNTDALRGGAIKTRMVQQVPSTTFNGGQTLISTAHVDKEFKLDPYAPNVKDLPFMKNGLEFKYVPGKFVFLTSSTWLITSAKPLIHKTNKASMYPRNGYSNNTGDTDLQELTMINIRSKHGPTGQVINLVVSQAQGLLPSLSEFHFLKSRKDKFGLIGPEGQFHDYRLEIRPDEVLKRTEVRDKLLADTKLQRAMEITSELCQIYDYWQEFPMEDRVKPKDLYKKLIDMGYDWDILLTTRGYWTFDHYESDLKPLTTMDLINMYHGRYIPWWYPGKDKIKVDKVSKDTDETK